MRFPVYFHDTANNHGIMFKSARSKGIRYVKGKVWEPDSVYDRAKTSLPLSWWLEHPSYPKVTKRQFLKIG